MNVYGRVRSRVWRARIESEKRMRPARSIDWWIHKRIPFLRITPVGMWKDGFTKNLNGDWLWVGVND